MIDASLVIFKSRGGMKSSGMSGAISVTLALPLLCLYIVPCPLSLCLSLSDVAWQDKRLAAKGEEEGKEGVTERGKEGRFIDTSYETNWTSTRT